MSEFGHIATRIPSGRVDAWGAGPFVIEAGDKRFRFEDSDRFGPSLVSRRGDILSNPWPPSDSPFWRAHFLWRQQGRRLEGVTCIWHEPKPTLYRIVRRQIITVERGEPDGAEINVTDMPLAMLPSPKEQP